MYLKNVEIIGFKSFANKTNISFMPNVNGVVGPNGCGKSNIIDAIKWVLGEQSTKNLRASGMSEVIFSGSQAYKKLNFAEVSLLFDNSDRKLNLDFEEVEITRRIYRNGESEYLINKSYTRLKDIVELLMDTGLGKDSLSIISQGAIADFGCHIFFMLMAEIKYFTYFLKLTLEQGFLHHDRLRFDLVHGIYRCLVL